MADLLDPRMAIDSFFQHQMTGAQLMRELAGYQGWIAPAKYDADQGGDPALMKIRIGGAEVHFFMFSDQQAYLDCRAQVGIPALGAYTIDNLPGSALWEAVDDDVDFVNINPFSPNEIHYTREQIPTLREWGGIMRVEQALDNVLASHTGYDVIKAFAGYYVGVVHEDAAARIALAPDQSGRALAAVFTSDDAADAYIQKFGQGVELRIFDGPALFEALSSMLIDGVVFNCCGPIQPRAFALPFAGEVLSRG